MGDIPHPHEHIPAPDEPSVPELEDDETIPPRPEEEIADVAAGGTRRRRPQPASRVTTAAGSGSKTFEKPAPAG